MHRSSQKLAHFFDHALFLSLTAEGSFSICLLERLLITVGAEGERSFCRVRACLLATEHAARRSFRILLVIDFAFLALVSGRPHIKSATRREKHRALFISNWRELGWEVLYFWNGELGFVLEDAALLDEVSDVGQVDPDLVIVHHRGGHLHLKTVKCYNAELINH